MFSNLLLKKYWQLFLMREKVSKRIAQKTGKKIVMQDDKNTLERVKDT